MEKRVYSTTKEKIVDFLIGFVISLITGIAVMASPFSWVLGSIPVGISAMIILLVIVGYLIWRKRKYMGIGFLFGIVAYLLSLASCSLALRGLTG